MNERINTVFHRTIDNLSAAMAGGGNASGGIPGPGGGGGGNLTDANRSRSLRQTRTPLTRSKAVKSPDWSAVANTPEWSCLGPPTSTAPPPAMRKGPAHLRNGVLIRSAAATIAIGGQSTSSEGDDGGAASGVTAGNRSTSSSSSGASAKAGLFLNNYLFKTDRMIHVTNILSKQTMPTKFGAIFQIFLLSFFFLALLKGHLKPLKKPS